MNVFVFPTCNEPGLEIIESLAKSNKIALFGGSSQKGEYDPARHLLEHYVDCPRYSDERFSESFSAILGTYQIDVVFPAWDPLVAVFAEWQLPDTVFVTPNAGVARLLLSKRDTYRALEGIVPTPKVYEADQAIVPLFAKPDRGSGSRDAMMVETPEQLRVAAGQGLILCEYLPGDEYTVDCFSDLSGRLLFFNVRIRGSIKRGTAIGTRPVDEPVIRGYVEQIARTLRIEGPWFAQFKKNAQGEPVLMEINARVGGSMTMTRLCGVNIPLMSVFLFTGHEVRVPEARYNAVLNRSLRNFCESDPFYWALWDWDDTLLRKDGKPDPEAMACLYDLHNRGIVQILLSRNPEVSTQLRLHRVPDLFVEVRYTEDKLREIGRVLERYDIDPSRCVAINDSYGERFRIQERYPSLRIIAPDALDSLGRERIS